MNILKNDKLSADEIVRHLASSIDEDIECSQEYKELYEKAYGTRLSNEILSDWVHSMAITDGSDRDNGQKWTVDQCYDIGSKLGIDFNRHTKYEWYAVMNMAYSDNYKTGKAFGLENDPLFFGRLAKDWICDEDIENKLYNYYFSVVIA